MRRSRVSWLIAIAMSIAAQANATEDCVTQTPHPGVRQFLEKQAARLLAPDVVDRKSLWFCAYGGINAEAVIDALPRRLPDGSDLVRQVSCWRYDRNTPPRWKCTPPSEYRKTEMVVTIGDVPWHFDVRLPSGGDADPDLARRIVDRAIALSTQVTAQNRCGSVLGRYDLETFKSDFATKPAPHEKPAFTLARHESHWQVSRRVSTLTLDVVDGGEAQLECWAAAEGIL